MFQEIKSFLGTGWSFPPSFNKFSHTADLASDLVDIEESIFIILGTTPGERIMQPKFGSYIKRLAFETIDRGLIIRINEEIGRAILHFEPRIRFQKSEVSSRDDYNGVLMIQISYTVIITNTTHNMVYPFYFYEAAAPRTN
jgi:phage baseplate assembly protein W